MVADGVQVLFGIQSPSGRLPLTIPWHENPFNYSKEQYPGVHQVASYSEHLLTGYRYYNGHALTPQFHFGHGLTYTSFEYRNASIQLLTNSINGAFGCKTLALLLWACTCVPCSVLFHLLYVNTADNTDVDGRILGSDKSVAVMHVHVTNTGSNVGIETPQLYLTLPQPANQPPNQLKGFQKVKLGPGQGVQVHLFVSARDLSVWDVPTQSWAMPQGPLWVSHMTQTL